MYKNGGMHIILRPKIVLEILAIIFSAFVMLGQAYAQSCAVPSDFVDIDSAIAEITCSEIEIEAGTVNAGTFTIDRDLTIVGAGINVTILKSTTASALALVTNGATAIFREMSLEGQDDTPGQWSGTGVQVVNGTAVIDNTSIKYFDVGLVAGEDASFIEMHDCAVSNNKQGISTIFQRPGSLFMHDCLVSGNTPRGGLDIRSGRITDSTIEENVNEHGAGGVAISQNGTLENVTVRNNRANFDYQAALAQQVGPETGRGGGIYLRGQLIAGLPVDGHNVVIRDSLIEGNYAGRWGGGVGMISCNIPQSCQDQPDNLARLHMINTTVRGNRASETGGGIYALGPTIIEGSLIESNTAAFDPSTGAPGSSSVGGGVYVSLHGAIMERTAIRDNFSETNGGGIEYASNYESELRIVNSTITENKANWDGGGIKMSGSFPDKRNLYLLNSTISSNWADFDEDGNGNGGGIGATSHSNLFALSSIVGANRDGSPTIRHGNCFGLWVNNTGGAITHHVKSFGGNVFGGAFDTHCPIELSSQASPSPDTTGQRPRFEKAVREGDTYVVPISANSPAVDAGYCETLTALQVIEPLDFDQRGTKRDPSSCDSGAYELH